MKNPIFIDNINGNTLARALGEVLGDNAEEASQVRIATAFFTPSGFMAIANSLSASTDVRLLLGADPKLAAIESRKDLGETDEHFKQRKLHASLRQMQDDFCRTRDAQPFTRTSIAGLRKLIAELRSGNLSIRRFEEEFLHAKAYIFSSGLIAGSSNLTGAGMSQNLELNLGRYDSETVERATQWFDALWDRAQPYDVAEIFEEVLKLYTPWEIFLRVLFQLYGRELDEDAKQDKNLPLTSFQQHGVARACRLIEENGGAIVADEVGLGKTFIAGEILNMYTKRRQHSLLVCPASLRDSTWKTFLARYQLHVACLSFEQLANDVARYNPEVPGNGGMQHIPLALNNYQLVIVDEAHNYRNPEAQTRAGILRKLLFGQPRELLLLTATPVNNSLWDLYYLMRFFMRQDAHLADRGILSVRDRFAEAMQTDIASLSPDMLYPIIDATTVKRTRQFVKKHYANDTISGPDGRQQRIEFPKPKALSVHYNLDDWLPGFFDKVEDALAPLEKDSAGQTVHREGAVLFARYAPDEFLLQKDEESRVRGQSTIGLLRCGLLKRFESSAYAFGETLKMMVEQHDKFLAALDGGVVVTTEFLKEFSVIDEELLEDLEVAGAYGSRDVSLYDVEQLRMVVEHDRKILNGLAESVKKVDGASDTKLHALANALIEIAKQAEDDASSDEDEKQNRKVLIYSFFADTVKYVHAFLKNAVNQYPELACYEKRIAAVSGTAEYDGVSRKEAVLGFAPLSMSDGVVNSADSGSYDLLVSTDVLAEGVNLQQCRHIINFDVPWNPMRLVQRHGRIDRIGSPHDRVFLRTIFPADRLDALLNLHEKILNKLTMAAVSVGVAAPIEGATEGSQVFSETRAEIEKLLREDASLYERGGTVGAAQTGEEYRQTLRKALQHNAERIERMPMKVGSGMRKGVRRGVFCCAVVDDQMFLRFVDADEHWAVASHEHRIVSELGTCLRLIECEKEAATHLPEALSDRIYDFWEAAQQDILREWSWKTDPANLQPKVRRLNHRVAEFIREHAPSGAGQEKALDILESPWPRREEMLLRGWFDPGVHQFETENERSEFLVEKILGTGLEAPVTPKPWPPISLNDIKLLCWLAIDAPVSATDTASE